MLKRNITTIIFVILFIILVNNSYAANLYPVRAIDKRGFIDRTGKIVIEPIYDEANNFADGLAPVMFGSYSNGKWGYINESGKIVIDTQYSYASEFSEGLAMVGLNGNYGFIDTNGKVIIPIKYKTGSPGYNGFHQGRAFVGQGFFSYICIDKTGREISSSFSSHRIFSEGLAAVCVWDTTVHKSLYGYIDTNANFMINPQFSDADNFSESLAAVKMNDKWGYIDSKGKTVIEPQFDAGGLFSEGLAPVKINGKYGVINEKGKIIVTPKFAWLSRFSEGLAAASDTSKNFGYIDKTGKFVITPSFSGADPFQDGIGKIWQGYLIGYINQKREYIYNPIK
jgi:hypothetical protein